MSGSDLHLELTGSGGARVRLMRALREAIRSGRLAPGTRLPPYRALALDLGIARNTVAAAYAELVEEGWLTARQGSGTEVAYRAAPVEPDPRRAPARPSRPRIVHDMTPRSPDAVFPRSAWAASAYRALTAAPSDAFGVCSGYAHGLRLVSQVLRGPVAVEAYGLAFHRSLLTEATGWGPTGTRRTGHRVRHASRAHLRRRTGRPMPGPARPR
ncbi:DNA-binding transcriptional regulator YhcF (GntR family) [Nonomuraea thailandensis]|uniref:DNA-binding transcriptional regulator YhcF (GntR family) n=1 Tax=Nonomuraea thailandensis TaxID=1188745 RepID=A0A9X2K1M4_9ACTN|nr:GntR family transcriptional regulator [Nonomuraea thailandensis]MCP2357128.1 DNA-binding transcriptional regulator YhcF (GntR family) [Nonomuraea thailandensis]